MIVTAADKRVEQVIIASLSAEAQRAPAEAVLTFAQANRTVVQDYCPLADSIEWELGQRYWQERGAQAFLGDARPVPYVVNNDSTLSRNAAEVFFASLAAADKTGTLPEQLFTLELGIGVGLFARYFLDAFRDLCLSHGTDYYDRLCYLAGDRSEPMLRDACRQGIFAHHPGRYLLRHVDALQPESGLSGDEANRCQISFSVRSKEIPLQRQIEGWQHGVLRLLIPN